MNLSNAQLLNFKDRIKFTDEDKRKFQPQIDHLVSSIKSHISEKTDTRVLKVLQCGSWRKGTILKPKDDVPVDIDLVFFLDIDHEDIDSLEQANNFILPILKSIYPKKEDKDFWDSPKTAGIEFVASGLNVDVVPVGKTDYEDYVAQPDKDSRQYFTSPKKQLEFISERKEANVNFTAIVRILKKWRNVHDVDLPSFAIELIVAHLDIVKGVEIDIQEAILRFLKLVSKKQMPVILFDTPYGSYAHDGAHTYIADPTNQENNIMKNSSDLDWNRIRIDADTAFETLLLAEEQDHITTTIDLWKEVFGSSFNIDPIEN
ncbi:nucleotidyltransferase [Candidatus Nomurabacteria bacterium]|nr:nucleotidyltransferase [Candidatus Nomurabacteria bacterium]